jgi:hypothetical protein
MNSLLCFTLIKLDFSIGCIICSSSCLEYTDASLMDAEEIIFHNILKSLHESDGFKFLSNQSNLVIPRQIREKISILLDLFLLRQE